MELTAKEEKAVRLVADDRVTITYHSGNAHDLVLIAQVVGDSDTYRVTIDPSGEHCTCPASELGHRECSHLLAVKIELTRHSQVVASRSQ